VLGRCHVLYRHPRMSALALTREVRAVARLEGWGTGCHPSRLAKATTRHVVGRVHERGVSQRNQIAQYAGGARQRWRAVIFVNGCFWHQHRDCHKAALPKSNVEFWKSKLSENVLRDRRNRIELERRGWRVFVVWECDVKRSDAVDIIRGLFQNLDSEV
jgi:DNA mismatch endonuclease (patch repair protein)